VKQPKIALLVIGDGRDHLKAATIRSFARATIEGPLALIVVEVDDREHRLGFGGAIRHGWDLLRARREDFDYVFHLECDWRFDRPIDLAAMAGLLKGDPRLAQVALRRGPVNAAEWDTGGVVEAWPHMYDDAEYWGPETPDTSCPYLDHGLYFTTNPSLYPRRLIERLDWPEGDRSEATFTTICLQAGLRFALWGSRAGGAWITHTGTHQRIGTGY